MAKRLKSEERETFGDGMEGRKLPIERARDVVGCNWKIRAVKSHCIIGFPVDRAMNQ